MKVIQFQFKSSNHSTVEIPKPVPNEDEVLVKVLYSALDTSHASIVDRDMTSSFIHDINKKKPLYLGYHFSGTIEAVGNNAKSEWYKGDDVFGFLQYAPGQSQGAFSEYITVNKNALAIKPTSVSHAVAAASTTESLTAMQALRDYGGLKKGGSVLVVGAAGGVGSAAVQIAKLLGASQVTAVCSTDDVAQVKAWGADTVIDRKKNPIYATDLLQQGQSFDVVLDAPNTLPAAATGLLSPAGGTLVNTIPSLTMVWNMIKTLLSKKKVAFVECKSAKEDLELLGKWLEDDTVKIPIESTFKINDMGAALKKQESRKKGRVVIQVENGWN